MSIIKIMDENLSNKIAAGEVVERISNVVKELVENSIDAKSKKIKIELIDAGTKQIKVIDDGIGMDKEDAVNAFLRHATSKIKTENDLYFISTLGFRGEALPSIASVSKIDMVTSTNDIATHVLIEGSKIINVEPFVRDKGTTIEINNIFYNTPARLKFLKTLPTELSHSISIIEKISLSHPEISFELSNNGKILIKTTGSSDLLKTIHEIYGYNIAKNMVEINDENYDYNISGYVSNININSSNTSKIFTFVNNRVVNNYNLNKIIKSAYHTFMPDDKFPYVFLNIESDPTLIDVNVHPTKQDIKFSKMDMLEDLIFTSIRHTLNKEDLTTSAYEETINENSVNEVSTEYENSNMTLFDLESDYKEENVLNNIETPNILITPTDLVFGTYLVCQNEENMYLIDIHASNERVNYEYYLKYLSTKEIYTTNLLIPIIIEFTPSEYIVFKENSNILLDLKIEYEEFGINTIKILSHPTWIKNGYEEESIRLIIDLIISLKEKFDLKRFNDTVAATLACKMSVKANTNISLEEKQATIDNLFKCDFPYTCPHGRPTIIKYTKYELEKLFRRVTI